MPWTQVFEQAWDAWVTRRGDGWQPSLAASAAALVPLPKGGRLPAITAGAPQKSLRVGGQRKYAPPPPPSMTPDEVEALPLAERQQFLETALQNRAPPPPGWEGRDVGGCPWHMREEFLTPRAASARALAEQVGAACDCSLRCLGDVTA